MNTIGYIKQVIYDEIRAIKEEIKESRLLAIAFLIAVVGLIIYLKPFPDRHVYFLTGYPGSDWTVLAETSAGILRKNGLDFSVIHTEGAVENVARLDDPKDVGNLVAYLLSDENGYVSGQVIAIDGGESNMYGNS